jgi:ChpA-C
MKKVRWVSATAGAALVAAMFALPGAGVAYASGNGNTTGNGNVSVLSGNTITAPISVPVNLCGISLAVAGYSNAGCEGGASSTISGVGDDNHNGNTTGNRNISGQRLPLHGPRLPPVPGQLHPAARLHDQLLAEHPAHRPARQPPGGHHHHGEHRHVA